MLAQFALSASTVGLIRVIAVIALVCTSAAVATPPGRLPLALRGVQKIIRRDLGSAPVSPADAPRAVSGLRRLIAFLLVIAAALVALV